MSMPVNAKEARVWICARYDGQSERKTMRLVPATLAPDLERVRERLGLHATLLKLPSAAELLPPFAHFTLSYSVTQNRFYSNVVAIHDPISGVTTALAGAEDPEECQENSATATDSYQPHVVRAESRVYDALCSLIPLGETKEGALEQKVCVTSYCFLVDYVDTGSRNLFSSNQFLNNIHVLLSIALR
jgi:hypothetical protein